MKIKKLSVAVSAALVVFVSPAHGEDEGLGGAPEVKLRGSLVHWCRAQH